MPLPSGTSSDKFEIVLKMVFEGNIENETAFVAYLEGFYFKDLFDSLCENMEGCIKVEVMLVSKISGANRVLKTSGPHTYEVNTELSTVGETSLTSFVDSVSDPSLLPEVPPGDFGNVTISESTAEATTQAGQWEYFIARQGNIEAAFNDESGDEEIILNFNISDRPYEVFLYENDCLSSITAISYTAATTSRANGFKNVNLKLDVDQGALQENSDIYSFDTVSMMGTLSFCVKFSLENLMAPGVSINFLETIMNVTIDMKQGFSVVNIHTNRDDASETNRNATVDYYVEAYQCDTDTGTALEDPEPLSQGSELSICIKTNGTDVGLTDIKQLNLKQDGGESINAILDSTGNGLTDWSCEAQMCSARTMLVSSFFAKESPNNVNVTGVVIMSFGSRRQLVQIAPTRSLESSSKNAADFQLELLLDKPESDLDLGVIDGVLTKREKGGMSVLPVFGSCIVVISMFGIAVFAVRRRGRQQTVVPLGATVDYLIKDDTAMA